MKFLYSLATLAVLAVGATTATDYASDATVPFAEIPEEYGPESDVAYVAQPGVLDANASEALTFSDINDDATRGRELQVVEGVIIAFQIAAAAAPLITQIINGQKKECQQVACWISTASKTCALSVAERVQAKMMMGKDRYRYESIQSNGMWARYWRTKFEPIDRGVIASGKCSNGVKFSVTNCQSTGQVHC
jgi:hypothetical protein